MSLYILVSDGRGLLHHIAQIAGHRKLALSVAHRTLHEQNLSAELSPGKTCDYTGTFISLLLVMERCRQSEILLQM